MYVENQPSMTWRRPFTSCSKWPVEPQKPVVRGGDRSRKDWRQFQGQQEVSHQRTSLGWGSWSILTGSVPTSESIWRLFFLNYFLLEYSCLTMLHKFLLYSKVKQIYLSMLKVQVTQLCLTLWGLMGCAWNSPGKDTRVGSHSLLQGIFLT